MANKELLDAIKKEGAAALKAYRAKKPKEHIDLSGAILPEAPFDGAVLHDVNLTGAYLRGAHLKNADLRLSVLNGANVEHADFSGAILGRTTLANLDLSKSIGVEKITFEAPCEIGLHTILSLEDMNAKKNLARGAGYSPAIVEALLALNPQPKSVRSAFIAYMRRDGALARVIAQRLEAEGMRTWMHVLDQPEKIAGFRDILTHLRREDWVVFLASESALKNEYVDKHIEKVIQTSKLQPVALDRYISIDWEHAMRNDMMQLRIVPFYDTDTDEKREAALQKLVAALRRGLMEHL